MPFVSGHSCPKCQYICSTSSSLKNHLRTHSDEKPFHCDFCPYSAKQRGNVKSHMKKRHADKLRSSRRHSRPKGSGSSSKRSSACEGMGGRVMVKEEGHGHEVGSGGRPIRAVSKKSHQCQLCGATFVKDHSLRCHMRHHASAESATLLPQAQPGRPLSEAVFKLSNVQPPAGLYIQLENELQSAGGRNLAAPKSAGYAILASPQDFPPSSSSSSRVHWHQPQKSISSRSLDQIVDAASRLYEEQYDVQTQTSDSQEDEGPAGNASQHVQIVQLPVGFSTLQYSDGTMVENLIPSDSIRGSEESLAILSQDHIKSDADDESKPPPVYLENIIISDGTQVFSSDGSLSNVMVSSSSSSSSSSTLQRLAPPPPPPGSSYVISAKSPQVSASPKVVTLISPTASPAKPAATASLAAMLGSSPLEAQPQRPAPAPSFVTYLSPAAASAPQDHLPSGLQQQQRPSVTSVGGQQFMLVQQADTKDLKFLSVPYSLGSISLSQISPASLPSSVVSVASAPQTLPTSSSRRSSRSRPRAIKPLVDLMPATSLPGVSTLPQALQGEGILPGIVTVAGSTFTTVVSNCGQSLGMYVMCFLARFSLGSLTLQFWSQHCVRI